MSVADGLLVGNGRVVVVNVVVVPGCVGTLVLSEFVGVMTSECVGMDVALRVVDGGNGSVIEVGVCVVVGWLPSPSPQATNQADAAAMAASASARALQVSLVLARGPSLIAPPDR